MPGIQLIYRRRAGNSLTIDLPTSKSMAARAIVIAAAAGRDPLEIPDMPVCSDTEELLVACSLLPKSNLATKGPESTSADIDFHLGLGGTSLRFFTALAASRPGLDARISCDDAMARRPVMPLFRALTDAGASIEFDGREGYPPFIVHGRRLEGGDLMVPSTLSSQFCSALMLAAPSWENGLSVDFGREGTVSFPYIDMTARMMRIAGAEVTATPQAVIVVPKPYVIEDTSLLKPEPDWSGAAYFYAFALLDPQTSVSFRHLVPPAESLQGDSRCAEIFDFIGVSTRYSPDGSARLICNPVKKKAMAELSKTAPLEFDMSTTPDLVPPLVVALCLSGIRFVMHGVDHLRHKESDRLEALMLEMQKVGYALKVPPRPGTADDFVRHNDRIPFVIPDDPAHPENNSGTILAWLGRYLPTAENETIDTRGDHRIAMAMALCALRVPYVSMRNPEVVNKSYPDFFNVLTAAGMQVTPFGVRASRAASGPRKRSWREQLTESDRRLTEAARRQGLLTPEGEPVINRSPSSRHKSMKQFARELRRRGFRPPKAVTPPTRLRPGHPTI